MSCVIGVWIFSLFAVGFCGWLLGVHMTAKEVGKAKGNFTPRVLPTGWLTTPPPMPRKK